MERYNFKEDLILQSNLLAGEASKLEYESLLEWRNENLDNNDFWLTLQEEWALETASMVGLEVDLPKAWAQVKATIDANESIVKRGVVKPLVFRRKFVAYAAIAAALVGVILLITTLMVKPLPKDIEIATTKTEVKELLLADGSEVTVNGASKFSHPAEFSQELRLVKLEGEAFFKVAKNKAKPFVVRTNGLEVKVVGTQFNVKDFGANSKLLQVTVVEGVVEVLAKNESLPKIVLHKGESAILNTITHDFSKNSASNLNDIAWKTKSLSFNKSMLKEVFQVLSETYKVELNVHDTTVLNKELTANFQNRDINSIMRIISSTFNFSYSISNGVVTIN